MILIIHKEFLEWLPKYKSAKQTPQGVTATCD